jgi:hypothetical protein
LGQGCFCIPRIRNYYAETGLSAVANVALMKKKSNRKGIILFMLNICVFVIFPIVNWVVRQKWFELFSWFTLLGHDERMKI